MPARVRWLALLALILVLGAGLLARGRREPSAESSGAAASSIPSTSQGRSHAFGPPQAASPPSSAMPAPPGSATSPASVSAQGPGPGPLVDEGYPVNLEQLRTELPGNRY